MKIENQIRAFAGTFILLSLVLYHFHSHAWLYFTAFVGANLLQSAFTHFCPLEIILRKLEGKHAGGCGGGEENKQGCC